MEKDLFDEYERFYFLGIGGISMSALAKLVYFRGYTISGYDAARSEQTEELSALGIPVKIGDGEDLALQRAEVVVYSDAIGDTDARLVYAKRVGKIVCGRMELLSMLCGRFKKVVSVAGSHGKTTCTAMCAHIFKTLNVPFSAHIGGEDADFGNFHSCGGEYFVTEACEYKKNMLKMRSSRAILLNIDKDHMECYEDEEDLGSSFESYCAAADVAFVCADDGKCIRFGRKYTTFGIDNPHCDYRATALKQTGEKYSFTVTEYGKPLCRIRLNAAGKCNVYNALAAFAAVRSFGFDEREIAKGLENFTAVKRRFERIGQAPSGATVICDYAHHPREIAATVETAKKICKGDLYVVFQPHTYSRTRLLMSEFVALLRKIPRLMIYKTYPAREFYDEAGSAKTLAKEIGNCLYAETVKQLNAWLSGSLKSDDLVLFLGAGDIYYAAQYLTREWNRD